MLTNCAVCLSPAGPEHFWKLAEGASGNRWRYLYWGKQWSCQGKRKVLYFYAGVCFLQTFLCLCQKALWFINLNWHEMVHGNFKKSPVLSLSGEKSLFCTQRTWWSSSQLRSSGKEAITDAVWMSFLFCKIKASLREEGKNQATLVIFRLTCAAYLIFLLSLWYFLHKIYTCGREYCIS